MTKEKILIVDDEKDVLMVLEKRLVDSGYAVIKSENGKEALIQAETETPDLIVLDVMMPGMDGVSVAETLKNNQTTKEIPVIFLTCLITKEEEKTGNVIAGEYFVAKPYNPDELVKIIDKQLGVYG